MDSVGETTDIGVTTGIPLTIEIPGYRLRRQVGSDSIGLWFDAVQEKLDRYVTVKVLKPEFAEDEKARRVFLAEMDRLQPLDHPNVLQVLGLRRTGTLALVTQRSGGKSLADLLEPEKPLGQRNSLRLAHALARGLAYLTSRGLAHKYVSPAFIKILPEGECRLITFRSIITLEELAALKGRLAQDANYVAPEQLGGSHSVGPRTHTYQVGALLYHMLAGLPPHVATTPIETAMAHLKKDFPSLRRLQPFLTADIYELIASCTCRDPANRPDLGELSTSLNTLMKRGPTTGERRLGRRRRGWKRR